MSFEVWVKAEKGHLVGVTNADQALILEREGERFKATCTQPRGRSMSQLALFWVICGHIADNLDSETPVSKEAVATVLKIDSGHADVFKFADGTYRQFPRSIAFNKMLPEDFNKLMDKMLGVAYIKFGPALANAARRELERMMAG